MIIKQVLTYLCAILLFPALLLAETLPLPPREPEIRAVVANYIQKKTSQLGYEIRIKKLAMTVPVNMPEGVMDYEIVAPQQWEGWGKKGIAVIVRQGNRVVQNISVQVEVEALTDMVTPLHQIDQGRVITSDDVILKKWDIALIQGRYLGKLSDVVGRKARNTLRPNIPLKPEQLEKVALIRSGQTVSILAESGNMRITVTGRARGAGAEGDIINVQNLNSLKEFPAKIVDATTVVVAF